MGAQESRTLMPELRFLTDPEIRLPFVCLGGDSDRFARVFDSASGRIPPEERRVLFAYWRENPPAPAITIENLPYLDVTMIEGKAWAVGMNVNGQGLAFRYAAQAMMEMPDDILETLWAHELAHVILWRELITKTLPRAEKEAWDRLGVDARQITEWNERFADERTLRWDRSLDCARLREWVHVYFRRLGLIR
jgi:hypothetical protein